MPKFITRFRSVRTIDVETVAQDRDAGLALARTDLLNRSDGTLQSDWRPELVELVEKDPDADPDDVDADLTVESWHVSGACESCSRVLFDAEGHHGEDVDLCDACFAAAVKDESSPERVHDLLGLVDEEVPIAEVLGWTDEQREQASRWAALSYLSASDHDDIEVPPRPEFLGVRRPAGGA